MYYLTITNLGVERCIHRSEKDIYANEMSFSCTPSLDYPGGTFLKEISIVCPEMPQNPVVARVYSD